MSDDNGNSTIELNRRRVLAGLGTIGVASAGAGAGTMALFSDTEESTGNAIQAGTLDLQIDGSSSATTMFSTDENLAPGESGSDYVTVKNNGSLDGSLDVNLGSSSVTEWNPEMQQAADADRVFESPKAFGNKGDGPYLLDDLGMSSGKLEIDTNNGVFTLTLPKELDPSAPGGGDSAALALDYTNDGIGNLQVIRQGGSWTYKEGDGTGWSDVSQSATPINGVNVKSPTELEVNVASSSLGDPFAVGSQVRYSSEHPPGASGDNLVVNLTPGFAWTRSTIEQGPWTAKSDYYVPIRSGSVRNLGDLLDIEVAVRDPAAGQGSETLIAAGKANRITDEEYEVNRPLPSGSTDHVVVRYSLSPNAGNAAQGETVEFDLTVELNQEDSQ